MPRGPQPAFIAKLFAVIVVGLVTGTSSAVGQWYTDYARILDVEPIKETVKVPVRRRRCDYSTRAQRADAAFAGDVRANHPGLTIGAAIGEEIRHRESVQTMHSCRTVMVYESSDRILAYRVRYAYGDAVFTRRLREYPQARLPVRVKLYPVE